MNKLELLNKVTKNELDVGVVNKEITLVKNSINTKLDSTNPVIGGRDLIMLGTRNVLNTLDNHSISGGGAPVVLGAGQSTSILASDHKISFIDHNTNKTEGYEHIWNDETVNLISDNDIKLFANQQNALTPKESYAVRVNGSGMDVNLSYLRLNNVNVQVSPPRTILWEGALYVKDTVNITPSKRLTTCANGWALVWSDWQGDTVGDWDFNITYIHKNAYAGNRSHVVSVPYNTGGLTLDGGIAVMCLNINDSNIRGLADNVGSAGKRDIVLRYIMEY